jgi:hypothetical protein
LSSQLGATDLLALSQGDVDGLASDELAVHLSDSLGGLIRGREANETETTGGVLGIVEHDLGGSDGTEGGEFLAELLVIDSVVQVLNVQVDTLVLVELLLTDLLVVSAELFLTFSLLLSTGDVQLLAVDFLLVHILDSPTSSLMVVVVDETESLGFASLVFLKDSGGDGTEGSEELVELLLRDVLIQVLDVNVSVLATDFFKFAQTLLSGDVSTDETVSLRWQRK